MSQRPNSPVCGITENHAGHYTPTGVTCPGLPRPAPVVFSWQYMVVSVVFWLVVMYVCTGGFFGALNFRK